MFATWKAVFSPGHTTSKRSRSVKSSALKYVYFPEKTKKRLHRAKRMGYSSNRHARYADERSGKTAVAQCITATNN